MSSRNQDTDVSKFLSYVLRHAPEEAGLTLDGEGWVEFSKVQAAVRTRFGISDADLARIIEENPKKRFTLDGERIRAAQGHSVAIDIALPPSEPPSTLYHGTSAANLSPILADGLKKMDRQHVHLSPDHETALIVARRRKGDVVILEIDAGKMQADGQLFFKSENGVWLTDQVPPAYISPITETGI
ncbi:RNA 2'-phosphotransferase [Pararhizobium sp. BT-229]|uniref:RNA 2'-phosphotransferase n=1 Tax=Pararhizobium sp. BT-229 TaxID=2986923 RepID=UPI0021F7040E|nr:RNA 2'-phosphotransferase [Pararhizobium sp. BT-229]MCV9960537.1 RNA 2'-phosphotransferase [Pararhizobium sp. BT-229]